MALLRWALPDMCWRKYAWSLFLLVFTNLLTGLGFYHYTYTQSGKHRLKPAASETVKALMPYLTTAVTQGTIQPLQYSYSKNCTQTFAINRPDYPYIYREYKAISPSIPTIFVITPTHACATQKVDLTSLCQTLSHVPKLTWIVIEDSPKQTNLVSNLLKHCVVESIHLNIATSDKYKSSLPWPLYKVWGTVRGVEQRNAGLRWVKEHHQRYNSSGVLYFADDDNKFDLRIFSEVSLNLFQGTCYTVEPLYSSHCVGRPPAYSSSG